MPDEQPELEKPEEGLVITFDGITKDSTPAEILHRVMIIQDVVLRQARFNHKCVYSKKLKSTARIVLKIDAAEKKEKVIATVRYRDVTAPGVLTPRVFSKRDAWERTITEAVKVFKAMERYAEFAHECLLSLEDRNIAPPRVHPNVYFSRFIKPLFGTFYKELHKHLIKENRTIPELPVRSNRVPNQPLDREVKREYKSGPGNGL